MAGLVRQGNPRFRAVVREARVLPSCRSPLPPHLSTTTTLSRQRAEGMAFPLEGSFGHVPVRKHRLVPTSSHVLGDFPGGLTPDPSWRWKKEEPPSLTKASSTTSAYASRSYAGRFPPPPGGGMYSRRRSPPGIGQMCHTHQTCGTRTTRARWRRATPRRK